MVSLARMGAAVTAVALSPRAIAAARERAVEISPEHYAVRGLEGRVPLTYSLVAERSTARPQSR